MSKSKEQRLLKSIINENNETINDMLCSIEHMEELIELRDVQINKCMVEEDLKMLISDRIDLEHIVLMDKEQVKVIASRNDRLLDLLLK